MELQIYFRSGQKIGKNIFKIRKKYFRNSKSADAKKWGKFSIVREDFVVCCNDWIRVDGSQ